MATQHDLMTKKISTGIPPPKQPFSRTERRGSRRCKITQLMRIRPSDPNKDHFEDLRGSVSVDRKSTRLNSSHANISYAVFCLKKKKKNSEQNRRSVSRCRVNKVIML